MPHTATLCVGWALAALMAWPLAAVAQDADGDGLPDGIENALGTDPSFAEEMTTVWTREPRADHPHPELNLTGVQLANVARQRWLWAISFAAPYSVLNSNLILYLDWDTDPGTGRRGMGCEVMLCQRLGKPSVAAFASTGESIDARSPRIAVVNGVLYLCHDAPIRQEGGQSALRFSILSETVDPYESVDSTGWVSALGPADSERPRQVALDEITDNEGFEATEGLDLIWQLQADPANIAFRTPEAELDGFRYYDAEYRWWAVTGSGGSITVTVPRAGLFHPAVVVYDRPGPDAYEMRLNGQRLGRFVANEDDNRQRLFFLSHPLEFRGGERLTIVAGEEGPHITEDIFLLAARPPVRGRRFELRQAEAACVQRDGQLQARVTWITTWPAACTVEYHCAGGPVQTLQETQPLANHRVYLTGLPTGATVHCRIRAPRPDGQTVDSEELTFVVAPPEEVPGSALREHLLLRVPNPHPFALHNWPVTSGVPFARGELGSSQHARLLDSAGVEVPLQATVSARWPDGSVKWLLVTFMTDAEPSTVSTYTLEYGTNVRPQPPPWPLIVKRQGDVLTVTTGPLQARFDATQSGFPTRLWYDGDGDGVFSTAESLTGDLHMGVQVTRAEAQVFSSQTPPERIEVEEVGPLRAVIKVTGHHLSEAQEPFLAYTHRFVFYAGQPLVRVYHTWGNDVEGEFTTFESVNLHVPLPDLQNRSWTVGLGQGRTAAGGGELSLRQLRDDQFELRPERSDVSSGRADGWLAVETGPALFLAAVRDFWQLYPKALSMDGQGLTLGLCPDFPPGTYDGCSKLDEIKLYFALMGGRYKIRQGMQKQHEILLAWVPAGAPHRASELAGAFQQPAIAICTPERYCDTRVFGEILPATTGRTEEYERVCERVYENYVSHRERSREYGMLNYGDQWGERRVNWANGEYDHHHAFLLQFARSGDPRWYYLGEAAARHAIDVDTCHYGPHAGVEWIHAMAHTGRYFPEPYEGDGIPWGGYTPSHTWTEGFYDWYVLSGDPTGAENAAFVADYYDGAYLNNYDFGNCRDNGWHLIFTLAAYRATNDPYYLNAARIIVERTLERQSPGGGWHRQMVPGHCLDMPRHRGEANFMLGVLANGLELYYNEVPDPRVAQAVVGGARQAIAELWVPEVDGFRYTSCPNMTGYTANNDMTAEVLFFAHRVSGEPEFADIAMRAMRAAIAGGIGSIAHLRWTPHIIYNMDLLSRGKPVPRIEGPTTLAPGEPVVSLRGTATDTDDDVVRYAWEFDDGTTAEGQTVQWRPAPGGLRQATLTVMDHAGNSASVSTTCSVPPAELMEAPPGSFTLVEAENFVDQGLDQVRVFERVGSHGKMITYWEATPGHWLEWEVPVPQEGDYVIFLRYCSGGRNPHRSLTLDGSSPGPAFDNMAFVPTGGFSTSQDNWAFVVAGGGTPVHLTAGTHRLRLTNLGDGLGLDYIVFLRR